MLQIISSHTRDLMVLVTNDHCYVRSRKCSFEMKILQYQSELSFPAQERIANANYL